MKEEREPEEGRNLSLWMVGASIPLAILLGAIFNIPLRFTISYVVVAALIFCSMALWAHANARAQGTEWWQDDDASGWRGY